MVFSELLKGFQHKGWFWPKTRDSVDEVRRLQSEHYESALRELPPGWKHRLSKDPKERFGDILPSPYTFKETEIVLRCPSWIVAKKQIDKWLMRFLKNLNVSLDVIVKPCNTI